MTSYQAPFKSAIFFSFIKRQMKLNSKIVYWLIDINYKLL